MTGATGNLYFGLHEFEDMAFLLHYLRAEDLFIDAGANVGSYTVLASGHVRCKTMAFEPIPTTFQHLVNNIGINRMNDRVEAFNKGLGKEIGSLHFTKSLDTVNHIATESEENTLLVEVDFLDHVLEGDCPSLIKIDVEGFETEVLYGAQATLKNPALKAIIIELNGSGARYGFDENEIHLKFLSLGFKPYNYYPFTRSLEEIPHFGNYNTIYIRDVEFVKQRLMTAEKIEILHQMI
ncbi:MAG: FkbM family methyltransferase [Cytophagales bacterium]